MLLWWLNALPTAMLPREKVSACKTASCGMHTGAQCSTHVYVGPPVQLEAAFAQPCFSMANEVPTQAVQNRAEGPEISLRLLDADALHTVPSRNADRYVLSL